MERTPLLAPILSVVLLGGATTAETQIPRGLGRAGDPGARGRPVRATAAPGRPGGAYRAILDEAPDEQAAGGGFRARIELSREILGRRSVESVDPQIKQGARELLKTNP